MMHRSHAFLSLFALSIVYGQGASELQQILERLERIEKQNTELKAEIESLRSELATARQAPGHDVAAATESSTPPLRERIEVQERRVEELAQTKVQSEQRFPVQLSGMLLVNAYWNGKYGGDAQYPTTAAANEGSSSAGGTFRQTIVGLKYQGPEIFAGGKVTGSIFMDFFAGTGASLNQLMRVRVASLDLNWKNTTLSFAQDKPIMAPREPNSLAQVGVSPLTAAGNLWLWQPQVRVEQRFLFGDSSGLKAQAGIYQTNESTTGAPPELLDSIQRSSAGYQGRFEFWHDFGGGRRIEIAPSFHASTSHAAGMSLPSRIYGVDWLLRPWSQLDITGQFFGGDNVGVVGGQRPGLSFFPNGDVKAISATGGWAQLTYRATRRTWMNFYAGQQRNDEADVVAGGVTRNRAYAANIMHRLAGNLVASFEISQVRTNYLGIGKRLNPHYDFALAYLY